MEVRSIKFNFILNITRLFLGTFFILLTMPYVARVLGSENLGRVEYANSIVDYFILFTALGIPNYGIREIARVRDNEKEKTIVVFELLIILFFTTILGYIIFFFTICNIQVLKKEKILMIIMGLNILFTNIGIEWFYQGIENQIYITMRFIIVRFLALGAMFLFVKNPDSYIIYGAIIVAMTSGSNILNLINLRKFINTKDISFKRIDLTRHLKPIMIIFVASLSVSIYLKLDTVMIGSISSIKEVGYYSIANKLVRLVLVLVTALGSIMIPRLSNCIKNNDKIGYLKYANYSLKYIFFISFPSVVGISLLSEEIVILIAGDKFISSVITMRLISPIILIVGIAHFIGYQILYPHGLEKYYTYSVFVAAIINFIFNCKFIPKYAQNGAAIGTVLAEIIGVFTMTYFARRFLEEIDFISIKNLKYVAAAIIMGFIILLIKQLSIKNFEKFMLSVVSGTITYFITLFIMKEEILIQGLNFIKNKIHKKIRRT